MPGKSKIESFLEELPKATPELVGKITKLKKALDFILQEPIDASIPEDVIKELRKELPVIEQFTKTQEVTVKLANSITQIIGPLNIAKRKADGIIWAQQLTDLRSNIAEAITLIPGIQSDIQIKIAKLKHGIANAKGLTIIQLLMNEPEAEKIFTELVGSLEEEVFKGFEKNSFWDLLKRFVATILNIDIDINGVNGKNDQGWAPVHVLCTSEAALKALVEKYDADIKSLTNEGDNVALLAASMPPADKAVEAIKYALSQGVDIHHRDNKGNNILHVTALNHRSESRDLSAVAQYAIGKGVDFNVKNADGETPFDIAKLRNCSELIQIFQDHRRAQGMRSVANDSTISQDIRSAIQTNFGVKQPLLTALQNQPNQEELFQTLHKHFDYALFEGFRDANGYFSVNGKNSAGISPIHFLYKTPQLLKTLVEDYGADINAVDGIGSNVILHAAAVAIADRDGKAPILESIKYAVGKGADITHCDNNGNNILHAVARDHTTGTRDLKEVFKYAIFQGVDFNATNKAGQTPLQILQGRLTIGQAQCQDLIDLFRQVENIRQEELRKAVVKFSGDKSLLSLSRAGQALIKQKQGSSEPIFKIITELKTPGDRVTAFELLKKHLGNQVFAGFANNGVTDVNGTDLHHNRPINYAYGSPELLKILVEDYEADITAVVNNKGENLLHIIADKHVTGNNNLSDVFRYAVSQGVDLNAVNSAGQTPFQILQGRPVAECGDLIALYNKAIKERLIEKAIKGELATKAEFEQFDQVFGDHKITKEQRQAFGLSLKDKLSDKALHKLVAGLLVELEKNPDDKFLRDESLGKMFLIEEAKRHGISSLPLESIGSLLAKLQEAGIDQKLENGVRLNLEDKPKVNRASIDGAVQAVLGTLETKPKVAEANKGFFTNLVSKVLPSSPVKGVNT